MNLENQYSAGIADLEKIFGKASATGFGSAVFHEAIEAEDSVERIAVKHYKQFLGSKWKAETESSWMASWKNVYTRDRNGTGMMAELASVSDFEAKRAIPLLTEFTSDPEAAVRALGSAFDHAGVKDLSVFKIGDGAEMAGLMITAIYDGLYGCSVIALMD